MSRIKEWVSDKRSMRVCFYVVFTATLLYIMFFIVQNFGQVIGAASSFLGSIVSALAPLLIGLIIAYILNPAVEKIHRKVMSRIFIRKGSNPARLEKKLKRRRTVSVFITFLLVLVVIGFIIYTFAVLIMGQLVFDSISNMVAAISNYFIQYEETFMQLTEKLANSGIQEKYQESIDNVLVWLGEHFSAEAIIKWLTGMVGGMLNAVLGLIVAIYLLIDKDFFIRLWRKATHIFLSMRSSARLGDALNDVNTALGLFIRGQLLDALIVAIIASTALTILGLDFAVFVGCFAGLANVIPYFGPVLGMIPAFLIAVLTGGIWQALGAVAILAVLQVVDGNFIYPKVVGTSTGLHPLMVLVAVTFGGYFWGILGMVLAVPTATILKLFVMRKLNAADEAEAAAAARSEDEEEAAAPPEPDEWGGYPY